MAPLPLRPESAVGAPAAGARSDGRVQGADGLRAFAACWVVGSHLFQRLDLTSQAPWLQDVQLVMMKGAFGVSIFFVLSGMLLSLPFWRAYLTGRPFPRPGQYARRRLARIAPGYYLSLAVTSVVALAVGADAPYRLARLLAGATFTSGFHWVTFFPVPINGPLWSIGFEVVSYVLMPLAMWGLFRFRRRGTRLALGYWVVVVGLVLAVNQWVVTTFVPDADGRGWQYGMVGGAKEWMPSYNPVGFFAHFCVGIATAAAITWWRLRRGARQHWAFDVLAAAGVAGGSALTWVVREPPEPEYLTNFQGQPYRFPLFALAVAVALVGLAHSRVLGGLVDNRVARYVAAISFGVYVWHYLIIEMVAGRTGDFVYGGITDPGRFAALSVLVLALTLAVASASWRWLERPVLTSRWARGAPRTSPEAPRAVEDRAPDLRPAG